ncbi:MAG TPA: hypothetical protein VE686_08280 [Beijerinckiaceae bacterium]|jgi:hypothetical protein|nr:hypothetical protein [Beijerinckiaceae bacterium]
MKKLALALALTVVGATAASAQIEMRAGPGGVAIGSDVRRDRDWDRGDRTTVIRREGRDWDRGDRTTVIRRDRDRVYSTGSTRCRTIIVKERDDMGRRVTKRIERC